LNNFDFWQTLSNFNRFSTKTRFWKNFWFGFWPNFDWKKYGLKKLWIISYDVFLFLTKFLFFDKISILDKISFFWQNFFLCLTKLGKFLILTKFFSKKKLNIKTRVWLKIVLSKFLRFLCKFRVQGTPWRNLLSSGYYYGYFYKANFTTKNHRKQYLFNGWLGNVKNFCWVIQKLKQTVLISYYTKTIGKNRKRKRNIL